MPQMSRGYLKKRKAKSYKEKTQTVTMNHLQQKYMKDVIPSLRKTFDITNAMRVPKITKVLVHVGTGKMQKDGNTTDKVIKDITVITGQKPAVRAAKKSIAGFKLREGSPVGLLVTLRGQRMYDFIDRLISIALPRSRDFQGLARTSFDEKGNLNIGIREHIIFPEVSYESLRDVFGFQVTVVTSAMSREEGVELLVQLGFPFKKK